MASGCADRRRAAVALKVDQLQVSHVFDDFFGCPYLGVAGVVDHGHAVERGAAAAVEAYVPGVEKQVAGWQATGGVVLAQIDHHCIGGRNAI
ncbi:MAG: hypothetical protein B7Y96_06770 [Comamonadaceae bacterium 32-67-11]|nr:MAG: hypothetical protein B7Y96_06770 [Comamonadaceae bacterium 32-67-11]